MTEHRQIVFVVGKCRRFQLIWTQKVPKEEWRCKLPTSIRVCSKIFCCTTRTVGRGLAKIRSVHTNIILWMFYFGGQCIDHLAAFFVKSLDILIFFCHSFIVINNLPFNSRKSFQHFSQLKVNIIEWQHSRNIKTSTAAKNYIVFAILRIVIVMGLLMCSMFPKYGSIFFYVALWNTWDTPISAFFICSMLT